jgi:RNA polymerase sigma-B factor
MFRRYADARDPVDRDAIVERFLPLARQIAARYQRPEEPFDDIFQVACYGLVKAVDRFDVERGVAFSSYAVPTIAGELRRYFRDRTWSVRPPRGLQERALVVEKQTAELTNRLGRSPTVRQIGQALELEDEEVLEAMQALRAGHATSLSTPRRSDDEGDQTLGDTLGSEDQGFALAEHRVSYEQLAHTLTARERRVIELRFGADLTQEEIGKLVGVSQMQVSRVLRQALAKLEAQARS